MDPRYSILLQEPVDPRHYMKTIIRRTLNGTVHIQCILRDKWSHSVNDRPSRTVRIPKTTTYQWQSRGELHRDGGKPALRSHSRMLWCENGGLHRVDGPSMLYHHSGSMHWYRRDGTRRVPEYKPHTIRAQTAEVFFRNYSISPAGITRVRRAEAETATTAVIM